MNWLGIATLVLRLIGLAEEAYKTFAGSGAVKKSTVMSATQSFVEGMTHVSTGGQKETWDTLSPLVEVFVDSAVGMANIVAPGSVSDEDFEKSKAGLMP